MTTNKENIQIKQNKEEFTTRVIEFVGTRDVFFEMLKLNPGVFIFKFGAEWCGPCKTIKKYIDNVSLVLPHRGRRPVFRLARIPATKKNDYGNPHTSGIQNGKYVFCTRCVYFRNK
jgi:thiol-disulfide isomerase/thioredoxin